jgi:hypothetical protein
MERPNRPDTDGPCTPVGLESLICAACASWADPPDASGDPMVQSWPSRKPTDSKIRSKILWRPAMATSFGGIISASQHMGSHRRAGEEHADTCA